MSWLARRRAKEARRLELEAMARTVFTFQIRGKVVIGPVTFDELHFMARYSPNARLVTNFMEVPGVNYALMVVIQAR